MGEGGDHLLVLEATYIASMFVISEQGVLKREKELNIKAGSIDRG